jgi:release factor glutamine methyltransferase
MTFAWMLTLSEDGTADVVRKLRSVGCVFAEEEAHLLISCAHSPSDLAAMLGRRVAGIPLEYIVGWAEFCGVHISLDSGVFIPRPRTELLAQEALAIAKEFDKASIVVDLCCGSGSLAAILAAAFPGIELHAVDLDPAAVQCAGRNISSARVYCGDLYDGLPVHLRKRVSLIVANAPYVPTSAIPMLPPEARVHEPQVALDGGTDGLDVYRRIAAEAPQWLKPGGHLLIEVGDTQAPLARNIFEQSGLASRVVHSDRHDATVVIGTVSHMPAR